jgi:hypothetical protein
MAVMPEIANELSFDGTYDSGTPDRTEAIGASAVDECQEDIIQAETAGTFSVCIDREVNT